MDGYYGSPTQYYQRRGERNEQKIQNLLNMMLAMKQMKYDRSQQEFQRKRQTESDVRAQKYLDIQEERLDIARRPKPTTKQKWQYDIDKPIPKNIPKGLDKHLIVQFGADWRGKISSPQFEYHRNIWKTGETRVPPQVSPQERQVTKQHKLDTDLIKYTIARYERNVNKYTAEINRLPKFTEEEITGIKYTKDGKVEKESAFLVEKIKRAREKKNSLTSKISNLQTGLDWMYSYQGNLASGKPSPRATRSRIQEMSRNIGGIEEGTLIEKMTREANLESMGKDKFGFTVGQIRQAPDGSMMEYIGDNQWRKK